MRLGLYRGVRACRGIGILRSSCLRSSSARKFSMPQLGQLQVLSFMFVLFNPLEPSESVDVAKDVGVLNSLFMLAT
jgi:hypothetical protein